VARDAEEVQAKFAHEEELERLRADEKRQLREKEQREAQAQRGDPWYVVREWEAAMLKTLAACIKFILEDLVNAFVLLIYALKF